MHAAFLLAAGLGTRLRPLTDELAKPLVPIGDEPLLAHIVRAVRASGVTRLVANAHFRAEDVLAFGDANDVGVVHERVLRGTGGGLAGAAALLGEGDVLVYNGDIWVPGLDLTALTVPLAGALARLAVKKRAKGEGNVGLRSDGTVVRLRRESFGPEDFGGEFLGIHFVSAAFRALLPGDGGLIEDGYLPAMARGAEVRAYCTDAPFVDVGTLGGYFAANRAWLGARTSWAHPSATCAAALDASIVGADALVGGVGALTRCVIWPGARVDAPFSDHVVTKVAKVPIVSG